jgi:BCCT family betaine/carnitine transporter
MNISKSKTGEPAIDPAILWPAIVVILATSVPLALFPEAGKQIVSKLLGLLTSNFGWLYLLSGIGSFAFMAWLAFSRFGNIKLGAPEDGPEFSKIAWISMLFCAGIGISIVNWAFVEPLYFLSSPPMGIAKGTDEAAEWAAMYPMFHWGVVPWALYLLPAIPIGYALYVRKIPSLRLSTACRGVIGDLADGPVGKVIDVVVIFSIIGGVGTSLGLSVPLVSTLFSEMFGFDNSFLLNIALLGIWTVLFSWSVYNGLGKGILVLSNVNIVLAFVLLVFVLLAGPTLFLLNLWSNSFGLLLDNFVKISFWTDPITKGGFPEAWTVFYWAWWIAYCPMMGLFVARVSRGRTIKDIIINGVLWGSVGCWCFFAVWGGYAIHLELEGILPVVEILNTQGTPATVVAILNTLPLSGLVIPVFTILCFVFLATTLDSSAYMLASICTKKLSGYEEPARWNRLLWAFIIAIVGVGLLSVGGLKAVQISTILVALPMIPVLVILAMSLMRWLNEDYGKVLSASTYSLDLDGDEPKVVKELEIDCRVQAEKPATDTSEELVLAQGKE